MITYKDAGVDIDKGDAFVNRIKNRVLSTYDARVANDLGGFCGLYEISEDKYLATGTDGVGTKLKIAQQLNCHKTIGIDLVAMCANDILCSGASPLFFLDYLASGKLDIDVSEEIIEGIVDGCKQAGMALIGGETAEMPGMYQDGEYDLAGFAVGEVLKSDLIDGTTIKADDSLIGLQSSGIHSNGFSLLRKLIDEKDLLQEALTPTRIYVKEVQELIKKYPSSIKGLAHITGGGLENVQRINTNFEYDFHSLPSLSEVSPLFEILKNRSGLDDKELYRTFNMGIGFVVVTDRPEKIIETLKSCDISSWKIGSVRAKSL